MRIKLTDIAKRAGVGHATVDRVINERGGVKPATAKRVLDAARELGLNRRLPSPYHQGLRIEIILARKAVPISARIAESLDRYHWPFDGNAIVERSFINETQPDLIANKILRSRSNAIIVYCQEHHRIIDAIAEVTSRGKPVITVVADIPTAPRANYVGINNYKAGRTAAFFLTKMTPKPGKILLVCNRLEYRDHAERISGCRGALLDDPEGRYFTDIIETCDNDTIFDNALRIALTQGDLVGVYNAGVDGMALEQQIHKIPPHQRPIIIGHELVPQGENLLMDGIYTMVMDQNTDLIIHRAMHLLAQRFGMAMASDIQSTIPFTIHVRDSLV